jgi:hypothetical protein
MYFLNRTGETLSIALFNAGDPSREATLCGPDWWWNGQEITKYDIGNRDSFLVCVALGKERDFGTFRTSPTPVIKGTFNKGTKVIAKRKHGAAVGYSIENYELLDWSNIESNYINYTDVSTKSTNALDRSAEIAAKTIGAVGAGIALIPIPPLRPHQWHHGYRVHDH